MRSMMIRRDPLSILEEIFQPVKYWPRMNENDVGTKDKPSIIVRSHMVERKYKAWRDPDGSYHEELVEADDVAGLPDNYGGSE